jgi:hypothetical protein
MFFVTIRHRPSNRRGVACNAPTTVGQTRELTPTPDWFQGDKSVTATLHRSLPQAGEGSGSVMVRSVSFKLAHWFSPLARASGRGAGGEGAREQRQPLTHLNRFLMDLVRLYANVIDDCYVLWESQ